MSYATIDDLRVSLGQKTSKHSPEYIKKMMHDLPEGENVDRAKFILKKVTGKRVLEFGASGLMHDAMVKVAQELRGVDRADGPGIVGFDLDDRDEMDLPLFAEADIIICGEVIEHLANPGWFLARLRKQFPGVPVVITVPNAYTELGRSYLKTGVENVNIDHVAWYSPRTLRTLVERYGYTVTEFAYYNGDGPAAEGLIVVVE